MNKLTTKEHNALKESKRQEAIKNMQSKLSVYIPIEDLKSLGFKRYNEENYSDAAVLEFEGEILVWYTKTKRGIVMHKFNMSSVVAKSKSLGDIIYRLLAIDNELTGMPKSDKNLVKTMLGMDVEADLLINAGDAVNTITEYLQST